MRNPVWIVNAGLLLLVIIVLTYLGFSKKRIPARKPLTPLPVHLPQQKDKSSIDVRLIYENDLFLSYRKPLAPLLPEAVSVTLPQPPMPRAVPRRELPHIRFLDPLKIVLKGVVVATTEHDNRAIIEDEKTKQEKIYAVGDMVEDAEIIRIQYNQVSFIRSNGQQETVFLDPTAAKKDPLYEHGPSDWSDIVHKVSTGFYLVDPIMLSDEISSLADFLDMLDVTVATSDGQSIGCRIGSMEPDSLGFALGFQEHDIVTAINDIPVATTAQRVKLYTMLKDLPLGAWINVQFTRNNQKLTYSYVLQSQQGAPVQKVFDVTEPSEKKEENEEKQEEPKHELASEHQAHENLARLAPPPPHVAAVQQRDKEAMKTFGGRRGLLQRRSEKKL